MWKHYELTMDVDTLVGGIPRHPEIVRRWQEARWPAESKIGPDDPADPEAAAEATIADLGSQAIAADEAVSGLWTGFVEDDGQLCIENRNVKAMLKESANILKSIVGKKAGKPQPLRARLAERVFVSPRMIPLGRATPDETTERAIHVMTAQGPRTALKRTDVCRKVTVSCRLKVLDDGVISTEILEALLEHGAENGLGTDRSTGAGTFTWVLTEVGD